MNQGNQNRPIARIDYLSSAGMVGERCYHYDYKEFLHRVKEDNYYGTPMEITVFRDEHGKTIPLDFMMELDPLPQGFHIEEYREESIMGRIQQITVDELRKMHDKEGLILQGCGGDLQEWLDGINEMFTEEGLLLNGTRFPKVYVFSYGELTNLLFPFTEDVDLNIGRLSIWRLKTHQAFGGTWLSDYVENNLGGFVHENNDPIQAEPAPTPQKRQAKHKDEMER